MNLYLAHQTDLGPLASEDHKIVLIGADLGKLNFGDYTMLRSTISQLKDVRPEWRSVVVYQLASPSAALPIDEIKQRIGADHILFQRAATERFENYIGLCPVVTIKNVSAIQMYGGGFLNRWWGEEVLLIVENFLRAFPTAKYLISGQQISSPLDVRFASHIREFSPLLVGTRDLQSQERMRLQGIECEFSFDDATEELMRIATRVVKTPDGLVMHLNSSGYSGKIASIRNDVRSFLTKARPQETISIIQAHEWAEPFVQDSTDVLAQLGSLISASNLRLVKMTQFSDLKILQRPVTARVAISSSYHVALLLQLAGVPCWLRNDNNYYRQKALGLGQTTDFERFLREAPLSCHASNLARREEWLEGYRTVVRSIEDTDSEFYMENRGEYETSSAGRVSKMYGNLDGSIDAKIRSLRLELQRSDASLEVSERNRKSLEMSLQVSEAQSRRLSIRLQSQLDRNHFLEARISELENNSEAQKQWIDDLRNELQTIYQGNSWRITSVLRSMRRNFQQLRTKLSS